MTGQGDAEASAALAAAKARKAIATRITALVSQVEDEKKAETVRKLAEAYAQLAAEPPRVRTG